MAATTVQVKAAQSNSVSVTVAITTTAGNLLGIVTGTFNGAGGAPSRTGEANNNAVADFADAGNDHLRGDYMMNIGGNSNTVTGNGTLNGTSCCVHEITGAKTTLALGATNHGVSATTTVQPGSITPTAGSVVVTGTGDDGTSGNSASTISDSAFTYTVDEAGGAGTVWDTAAAIGGSAHTDNVSASATNPTWTSHHTGTTHMASLIMEFLAAGGGGGGTPVPPPMRTMRGAGV